MVILLRVYRGRWRKRIFKRIALKLPPHAVEMVQITRWFCIAGVCQESEQSVNSGEAPAKRTWSQPQKRAFINKRPCRTTDVILSRFYLHPWSLSVSQLTAKSNHLQLLWPVTAANPSPALWDDSISSPPASPTASRLARIHSTDISAYLLCVRWETKLLK